MSLRDWLTREPGPRQYECRGCGDRFVVEYHVCPSCDGFRVERIVERDLT